MLLGAMVAVGACLVGWAGASSGDGDDLGDQVGWLNIATIGLVCALVGVGAFLFAGRRTIGQRRRHLLPNPPVGAHPVHVEQITGERRAWIPGTLRVHRFDCQLVLGKSTVEVDAPRIRSEQLRSCEVCGS